MAENICHNYHAEDDTCGITSEPDKEVCQKAACLFGNFIEPSPFYGEENEMMHENGEINWPLAFGFDEGFKCETFTLKG